MGKIIWWTVEQRTSFDGLNGLDPFLGSEPHNFESFAGKEADIVDDHAEPVQLQDRLKDQARSCSRLKL